ncbi:hypothetical protein G6F35_009685 [Rhizopus arrhizus]|nr:hypothetical protein G6F35_009685 [Rhizopus arrhizus]
MSEQQLPIIFTEHAQLQALGVNSASIGFNNLTMESEKYICVRETVNGQAQVVIIDLSADNEVIRRPITADSAIMHPKVKVMALKAQRQIQVFNLDTKTKLKSHAMAEDIVFWKWLDTKTIGIVTEFNVYRWSIEGDSPPVKIFERHASLSGCQIINLRASSDEKWFYATLF